MPKGKIIVLLFSLQLSVSAFGKGFVPPGMALQPAVTVTTVSDSSSVLVPTKSKQHKLTTFVIAILTGPLGGHRVYLGTSTTVPLIYTITLGGFGSLVVADIIALAVTKHWTRFKNNQNIIMWIPSKKQ